MNSSESYIYMNNAATSWPKPSIVAEAMAKAVGALPGAANRGGIQDFDVFSEVRKELAEVMGISCPEQIALGSNSTWGLNQGIFGYPLKAGDTVLTTTAEHNAVLRPLYRLEENGVKIHKVSVDKTGRVQPEMWKRALKQYRPQLCVLIHASNVTGAVNDAAFLTKLAKEYGADMLLDVSQTLGCIPVELESWGVDLAAFTGHKYLLGPQGTGGLYVRPGLELRPYIIGGTGVMSDLKDMPLNMPLHLEAGTGNEPSYHGLLAALKWNREHPMEAEVLYKRVCQLSDGLQRLGCRVIIPEGVITPVVSFVVPGIPSADVSDILMDSYDIICRVGLHCAPEIMEDLEMPDGTIRLSLSRFTTSEEVEQVLGAVQDIVESGV
ncbi:MAG: aminotransferase class V-fold PLP-dependent enzyme [Lachnospiraceae bacterium]|nr:aminotransferase class V-fold PLP-dependent enzyme [Lachnospiraceae bacterium]